MASFLSAALPSFDPYHADSKPSGAGTPVSSANQSATGETQQAQLSSTEQMRQMAAAGQSVSEISSALGVPQTQVDTDLGISTQTAATALTALSIKA